jgi:DNA-binding NarL/FixJ family response regulator
MTSQRSLTARELEQGVRELSLSGKTIKQMAAELGTTESNVKQIRRRQGLPLRQRGRPPKK